MSYASHILPLLVLLIARPALASFAYTGTSSTSNSTAAVGIVVGLVFFFIFSIIICSVATKRARRQRHALYMASEDLEYNRRARLSSRLNREYEPDSRYPTKPAAAVLPPYKSTSTNQISTPPPSYQASMSNRINISQSRL